MQPTTVTFPSGALTEETTVADVRPHAGGSVVILQQTPFHPVDHTWPDQPGDTGTLTADGTTVRVANTVMVAIDDAGVLAVGEEIPVKRGADGWDWHVGHLVAEPVTWGAGTTVQATVDGTLRAGLSRGHTACHLASLALDAALAELWHKDPGIDPLGSPNFEARAGASSQIHPDGSVDTYRLGKSLRKAGFRPDDLAASLAQREAQINDLLAAWVASSGRSWIEVEGDTIADRCTWHCALPAGEAHFLCGGTHVDSLDAFASITVALDLSDPQLLVMTTAVVPSDH